MKLYLPDSPIDGAVALFSRTHSAFDACPPVRASNKVTDSFCDNKVTDLRPATQLTFHGKYCVYLFILINLKNVLQSVAWPIFYC